MSGSEPDGGAVDPERRRAKVRNRIILWVALALVLLAGAAVAASAVPRWWSQQMGELSDGGLVRSALWGLAFGFVFTFLPALVISRTVRRWKGWKAPLIWIAVAIVLAAPNLFTAWIVFGTSGAAHGAERTLDVRAPYFTAWTGVGAVLGLVVAVGGDIFWRSWRRRGKKLKELRDGEAPGGGTPPAPPRGATPPGGR
ncbi:hypothetical protein [Xylanimonas protaetiae]|uniref:Permease n=1 Tax=Xylanimonas protaetiae TaxID=2509457 RepID=A0A4P6F0Z8_9MICO|nr:hypothetical protein [Xylanimonas protaetiae]QAY69124.1 hypothetical protein ET471_02930 [Xylanimonas protaetiae]